MTSDEVCFFFVIIFYILSEFSSIQNLAITSTNLSNSQKYNLHVLVISLLVLIADVVNIQQLSDYAVRLIEARREEAPHCLPEMLSHYPPECEPINKMPHLLVDQVLF